MSVTDTTDPAENVRRLFTASPVLEPKPAKAQPEAKTPRRSKLLVAVDYGELMDLQIAVREALLGKWLMQQSLNMIHARRGTGKTHVVLGIAYAVATGTSFLGWKADQARPVLFVDGELPARVLQDRLREIELRVGCKPQPGYLRIVTPDLLGRSSPDLASLSDQAELDELIDGADLVILDNLSALIRSGAAENDAESWVTVSDWALRHRAAGRSIIFVHHSGKNGAQRGTSRREDLLDAVISLRQPHDYEASEGARFEVHFEKARHLAGPDVESFEAALDGTAEGGWAFESMERNIDDQIIERLALGLSLTDIGRELGLHKSNVSRRVRDLRDKGVLPADGSAPQRRNPARNGRQKKLDV